MTAAATTGQAGHVSDIDRGLFGQGLLPGSTGLDAPLGDATGQSVGETRSASTTGNSPLRVYVVVVDGLRPQEVGPLTPTLSRLRDSGTWYEQARSVLPAETLPNHAAMATGVPPERNGIVANQIFRGEREKEYMQYPEFWEADTITTRLERAYRGAVSTATVLSKEYLYGVFLGEHEGAGDTLPQREADFHWDPRTAAPFYVDDPSDHAMDPATMNAFLGWVGQNPSLPQFGFVNLGDVDRAGHADESGVLFTHGSEEPFPDELGSGDVSAFRQAAIEGADSQIGRLVSQLEQMGAWDETVLIVLSDHGMDWGFQDKFPKTTSTLDAAGYARGTNPARDDYWVVGGGGSELVYVHHEPDVADIARRLEALPGVEYVATRERVSGIDPKNNPTRRELGIEHPYSPAIEVFVDPGYHSDPVGPGANPLPGNHGHSATQHVALMVGGGHPVLRTDGQRIGGETVFDRQRNRLFVDPVGGPGVMSIAPTVAALFGIGEPRGGYAGRALTSAFVPGAFAPPGGSGGSGGGTGGASAPPGAGVTASERPVVGTTLAARPTRVRYGQAFTLSGNVAGAAACGDMRVALYRGTAASGAAARVLATSVRVGRGGAWSHTLRSPHTGRYFARVQPTRTCDGSISRDVAVPVRARVDVADRCPRTARVGGRVLPGAPRTSVRLERRVGRRYRRVASRRLSAASRFSFALPSCRGRYRVVWSGRRGRNLPASTFFVAGRGRR